MVAVLGTLGVLVAWAGATAGAMSTAAIESIGVMGSFFKTKSSCLLRIPCAGACAQGPGEQRGLGWVSARGARLQQWLDPTIVQSISSGIAENQPYPLQNDVQIQPQRPVAQVVEIAADPPFHLFQGMSLAPETVDLGPAGDARLDLVP